MRHFARTNPSPPKCPKPGLAAFLCVSQLAEIPQTPAATPTHSIEECTKKPKPIGVSEIGNGCVLQPPEALQITVDPLAHSIEERTNKANSKVGAAPQNES